MKRLPLTHLLVIAGVLVALAAGAWFYTNANEPVEPLPSQQASTGTGDSLSEPVNENPLPSQPPASDDQLVDSAYHASASAKLPGTKEACDRAGGKWNECASACPPGAEVCTQVCIRKCEGLENETSGSLAVYFPNSKSDPSHLDCSKVFPLKRTPPETGTLGILKQLLLGVTAEEAGNGYFTSIPAGVKVLSQSVKGSVFSINFSKELQSAAGSCRAASIRSQIEATVKNAFPKVKTVVITIEGGSPDEALQP